MRIVLDSNIYISAFFWGGLPRKVLKLCIEGHAELVVCREILDEVTGVMGRDKFGVSPEAVEYYRRSIEDLAQIIVPEHPFVNLCRDPADNMILQCALTACADYLVTGDEDLLVLKNVSGTAIVTVADFLDKR